MKLPILAALVLGSSVMRLRLEAPNVAPLVHTAIVDAPQQAVFDAIATGPGEEAWNVAKADADLRVGGKIRAHYSKAGQLGDPQSIEHTILSLDPPRMLSFRTTKAPASFPFKAAIAKTWVVFYFEPIGAKQTRVTIRMLGYDATPESQQMRRFFDAGNKETMGRLVAHFKQHR